MKGLTPETTKILEEIVTSWDDYEEMSFMAVVQRLRVFHLKDLPLEAQRALRRGGPLGDLYHIWSRYGLEPTRMQAAERIAKDVGSVIHPNLWPYLKDEEQQQADLHHGGNGKRERRQRIITALFELLPVSLNRITAESIFAAHVKLRSHLQTSVTNDLLGPTWRQSIPRKPQEKGDCVICPPYECLVPEETLMRIRFQVEDLPMLTDCVRELQLSPRQTVIAHLVELGYTFAEIATHLAVSPNTIRQHVHTIRNKSSQNPGR
jgi:hypothetical protein